MASLAYAQDYDEFLPASYKVGPPVYWTQTIAPYVKNTGVYNCPSLTNLPSGSWGGAQMAYGWNYYYLTYNPGGRTANYNQPTAGLAQIQSPAETVMVGDGPSCSNMPAGTLYYPDIYSGTRVNAMGYVLSSSGAYFPNLRHMDLANIGFCDGHVKACTMGYLGQSSVFDLN